VKTDDHSKTLMTHGVDPSTLLGECKGDCDTDADCKGALACFHRNGLEPITGCAGQGQTSYDYCYDKSKSSLPKDTTFLKGSQIDPTHTLKLGRCSGDCDSDADCRGTMTCFQRSGKALVPGCKKKDLWDYSLGGGTSNWDYCVEPVPVKKNMWLEIHRIEADPLNHFERSASSAHGD
jgi:hypothetical protein